MVRPKEREAEIFFGDLRSVAGQDAVNRLIEACGGTVVYIPRNGCRDEASPLAQAWSGLDAANAIIQKLNSVGRYGIKINIPLRHMSTYSVVGEKIRADILSGAFSVADIAARFGVTQRTIYNHKKHLLKVGLPVPSGSQRLRTQESYELRKKLRLVLLASDTQSNAFIRKLAADFDCAVSFVASVRHELSSEGAIKRPTKGPRHG